MKKTMLLLSVLCVAACGGDVISKSDVQKALDNAGKYHAVCVPFALDVEYRADGDDVHWTVLGTEHIRLLRRLDNGKRANQNAIAQMEILVDAGLYRQDKDVRIEEGKNTKRYSSYSITPKGRDTFMPSAQGTVLCVGREKVEKIHYATAPTPANGFTVSKVSYDASVQTERWARSLLKNSPYYEGLKQTETRSVTLVKTDDGWRSLREVHH